MGIYEILRYPILQSCYSRILEYSWIVACLSFRTIAFIGMSIHETEFLYQNHNWRQFQCLKKVQISISLTDIRVSGNSIG